MRQDDHSSQRSGGASRGFVERRELLRKNRRIHVSMQAGPEKKPYVGQVHNISVAGAFIALSDPPPQGSRLTMEFLLPDNTRIHCEGTVMWCDGEGPDPGIGVKLQNIGTAELDALAEVIEG